LKQLSTCAVDEEQLERCADLGLSLLGYVM